MKSFFGGLFIAGFLLTAAISQRLLVTAYQAERSAVLMGVYVALNNAQSAHANIHDAGWCYTFTKNTWQSSVIYYDITSAELNQSVEDLLCHGGTAPADL
jgi:hypothetical protein